jgi:hypothetical protein
VHQALRSGGWFIVSVPQHPWLWSANDEVAHHERRYRTGELQKKLRDAGFSVVYSDSFTSLLLPAMAASRLLERFSTKPQPTAAEIADREFRISGWLNGFLRATLRFEHLLRRMGCRFPAGGSRVVVARKPS